MKRFNKTAVALATAGAMTIAMVPNATAEEGTGASYENRPAATSIDELINSANSEGELGSNAQRAKDRAKDEEGYSRAEDSGNDMKAEDVFGDTDPNLPPAATIPNPANPDQECYLHNSGEFYVFDRNDWNTPADQIDDKCKVLVGDGEAYVPENGVENSEELKPGDVFDENPAGDDDKDTSKVFRALAGLAGAGAVIYLLGKAYQAVIGNHGPVLLPPERVGQAPTAEDEAATEQLVADHGEEIVAQAAEAGVADNGATAADGADADRGVSAATGNNNIAQGLIGLLLASILGAAAFVFGRRQLV